MVYEKDERSDDGHCGWDSLRAPECSQARCLFKVLVGIVSSVKEAVRLTHVEAARSFVSATSTTRPVTNLVNISGTWSNNEDASGRINCFHNFLFALLW